MKIEQIYQLADYEMLCKDGNYNLLDNVFHIDSVFFFACDLHILSNVSIYSEFSSRTIVSYNVK